MLTSIVLSEKLESDASAAGELRSQEGGDDMERGQAARAGHATPAARAADTTSVQQVEAVIIQCKVALGLHCGSRFS